MKASIKNILQLGLLSECDSMGIELTMEIFRQFRNLEYKDASSDKANLSSDWCNIGNDVRTGIMECKRLHNLEML